ncbi:MAG: methylenetetrahydrofolate reductase [Microthrixaceae bacterium]|nr:methylenetetrahydrofolate reductase [Microthrixaceae bacterium]
MSAVATPSQPAPVARRTRVPVSFELYPPRTDAGHASLEHTIDHLTSIDPGFISVTYGAGGTSGGRSLEVLRSIRTRTSVEPLAHLTCVGNTYAGAAALIREFLDAGILSFLALRGDPPVGSEEGDDFLGDLGSAAELVQLIHRVQAERAQYAETTVAGVPGAAVVGAPGRARIAVAAFPNGHPRSRGVGQDIDTLLSKQAAGATLAITQLFFHADQYLAFVSRAQSAGVTIPILPGIMPITNPARLRRVLELSGEEVPAELEIALQVEPDDEGRIRIGIEYAAELSRQVLAGGAPGIHLYAFNEYKTVLAVLESAGLIADLPFHSIPRVLRPASGRRTVFQTPSTRREQP